MKLPRLRTFILITGTLLSVLIAAAFVVSAWWLIGMNTQGGIVVLVQSGTLVIGLDPFPDPPSLAWHRHNDGLSRWLLLGKREAIFIPLAYVFLVIAIPTLIFSKQRRERRRTMIFIGCTGCALIAAAGLMWSLKHWQEVILSPIVTTRFAVPFLAVAVLTLLVWRFMPKFPRGHCRRCGYNLKGLTEARCPECGTGFVSDRV